MLCVCVWLCVVRACMYVCVRVCVCACVRAPHWAKLPMAVCAVTRLGILLRLPAFPLSCVGAKRRTGRCAAGGEGTVRIEARYTGDLRC